jgi:SPP1 family phage portal protein
MNIEKLNLSPTSSYNEIEKAIKAIKTVNEGQANEKTPVWIDQYNGIHDILKKDNKNTVNGFVELQKTVINYQKMIVDLAVAFLLGNPITLNLRNPNDENSKLFEEFKVLWQQSKTDTYLYNLAKNTLIESRGAIQTLKDIDNVRHSLINHENSEDFFLNFNNEGKADSFERTFKIKDYNVESGKVEEHSLTDLLTNKQRWITNNTNKEVVVPNKEDKGVIDDKIPVVYAQVKQSEFEVVQNLIDRLEKVVSKNGDSNDYFAEPTLIINGKLASTKLKKGQSGNILEVSTPEGKEAKISYLTWDRASESYKLEVEFLINNIFAITSTPRIDFDNVKGLGTVSGVALELMFLATTIKTKAHIQTTFNEVVSRLISVIKNQLSNIPLKPDYSKMNDLEIDFTFNDGIPTNIKELIETLVFATNGNIMSKETATEKNPLVDNSFTEIEQIKKESVQSESFL